MINKVDMSGTITSNKTNIAGTITAQQLLSGEVFIPETIASKIYYDTTEMWNSQNTLVAQKGCIYIYKDYRQVVHDDGSITTIPSMKIGDGTSYLIDLPFADGITQEDREFWNNKVSIIEATAVDGTLTFTTRKVT